jgi:hypothetical protein
MMVISWLALMSALSLAHSLIHSCNPGYKADGNGSICVDITNRDVLGAIHWLANPPAANPPCSKIIKVQGIDICEDYLPSSLSSCNVVSFIATTWCDHFGSLDFERYWADRGCNVTLYHYHVFFKGMLTDICT